MGVDEFNENVDEVKKIKIKVFLSGVGDREIELNEGATADDLIDILSNEGYWKPGYYLMRNGRLVFGSDTLTNGCAYLVSWKVHGGTL